MNGPHDMGGMQCYGPVAIENPEPLFHADWERRALAITVAAGATGLWNIDISRHARETLPPAVYLSSSYYEIWIRALEKLLAERGWMDGQGHKPLRVPDGDGMRAALARGSNVEREAAAPPRFKAGDPVRAANMHPGGHTRLPRYVRGKLGVIEAVHGVHVFADSHAHGKGEDPQWLYCVRFAGPELFGAAAEPGHEVCVDCWEPYLEAA